ncbi:MAG TPA: sigma-70 family RNA polymerase sigma factor [Candidatus Polarisedimenticolaceae bacterium]|nr:sigma-70 family RNA polymerase sigma factor [Candidatus Polarisedimenticolaceae bacterium]
MHQARSSAAALDSADDPRTDEVLIAEIARGDETAFEALVQRHAGQLLAVARRMLRDAEEARDAVQEALLSVYRHAATFERHCRATTWLHRIVVNAALMRLRGRKRRRELSIEDLLPKFAEDGHHAHPIAAWPADVTEELEREQRATIVRRCIDRLPEAYRTVLLLREIDGLNAAETARLLRTSANAVNIRLHRARLALRTLIDPILRGETVVG